ncbi:MAG: hypothetical protein EOM11_09475 [Erysipelotrichia bacterium]|nr:hypothetical protein [Erysipelotrichia bacterium]
MNKLKESAIKAKSLSDEGYLNYWIRVIDKYYEHAYKSAIRDTKIIQRLRDKRNTENEDEFYEELKKLQQSSYIENSDLRMLNNIIPNSVRVVINMLKLTLQDIANLTKQEVDSIHEASTELRNIIYRLNP